MTEYIEREALLREFDELEPYEEYESEHALWLDMRMEVINAPAADVAPVRHGRWIEPKRLYYGAKQYECSICYSDTFWKKHSITEKYPHCPNCGVRMDGGDE